MFAITCRWIAVCFTPIRAFTKTDDSVSKVSVIRTNVAMNDLQDRKIEAAAIANIGESIYESANKISVVPDFTSTLSIFAVPGSTGRLLVGALGSPSWDFWDWSQALLLVCCGTM